MSEMIQSALRAWPWPVEHDKQVEQSLDLTPSWLREALEQQFDSYDLGLATVGRDEDGMWVLEWDGEWNYGLVGNCENLLTLFQENDIAYVVTDDAKYEFEAEIVWWHPGMEKERHEQGSQDSGHVLTKQRLEELRERATDLEDDEMGITREQVLGGLLDEFFEDPWSWKPPETGSKEEEILADPHTVESCTDEGEDSGWRIICSCGWEAWGQAHEARARAMHAAHQRNPVADDPFE